MSRPGKYDWETIVGDIIYWLHNHKRIFLAIGIALGVAAFIAVIVMVLK